MRDGRVYTYIHAYAHIYTYICFIFSGKQESIYKISLIATLWMHVTIIIVHLLILQHLPHIFTYKWHTCPGSYNKKMRVEKVGREEGAKVVVIVVHDSHIVQNEF